MGRNHLPEQVVPKDPTHLPIMSCNTIGPSGISSGFPKLSPSRGQLDYVLLARPPLYSSEDFHVRLACLIHAANVRSEPGSNPSLEKFILLSPPVPRDTLRSRAHRGGRHRARPRYHRRISPAVPPCPRDSACSHAFFRGHPECQRSHLWCASAPRRGAKKLARGAAPSRARLAIF